MNLRLPRLGLPLVLAAGAASCLLAVSAFGQGQAQPRRSIELSETNSAEILANLNQLSDKKDEFKQLDEQLRTLKDLTSPKSSQQRFSVPYLSPAVPNRRLKDLLNRQKSWTSAEDLNLSANSDSEISAFEGIDKIGGKDASLRQFYNALNGSDANGSNQKGAPGDKSGSNKRSIFTQDNASEDNSSLPPEIRDRTEQLQKLVNADPNSVFNPARPRSSFQNFFGSSSTASSNPNAAQNQGPKGPAWLDQFQNILDSSVAAGVDPTLNALAQDGNVPHKTITPEITRVQTQSHQDDNEPAPARNSKLDVTSVSDINASILNQWNPLYVPPKLQLPKVTPPTPPNLDFPRRKF